VFLNIANQPRRVIRSKRQREEVGQFVTLERSSVERMCFVRHRPPPALPTATENRQFSKRRPSHLHWRVGGLAAVAAA
jgi:hypothetical protein